MSEWQNCINFNTINRWSTNACCQDTPEKLCFFPCLFLLLSVPPSFPLSPPPLCSFQQIFLFESTTCPLLFEVLGPWPQPPQRKHWFLSSWSSWSFKEQPLRLCFCFPEVSSDLCKAWAFVWSFVGRMMALEDHGPWGHYAKITVFMITIVVTITANIKSTFLNLPFKL